MNYNGTLVRVGTYNIPLKYMRADTYVINPDQRQDLDSYRDTDGVLHRNALSHTATKIEFNVPYLHLTDFVSLWTNIESQFTVAIERKCNLTYYEPKTDIYKAGTFYIPDDTYTMYMATDDDIVYNEFRIAFIEY